MPTPPFPGEISIVHRYDSEISGSEDQELRQLLIASFPYATILLTRRYIREIPTHRWLVRSSSGELIAHTAVHDKVISASGRDLRIGGIAEVCVAYPARGHGLVRKMLAKAHAWMRSEGIPFAMLFGQPKVYASSGYSLIENPIRTEHPLIQQLNPFKGKPMIHPISNDPWPNGPIDLRGPTF